MPSYAEFAHDGSDLDLIEVESDPEALVAQSVADGWGDGLPLIPPTPDRVMACLQAVALNPQQTLGLMPPSQFEITAHKLAANAVLAGCSPKMFPVVVAAVRAMLDPTFNLSAVQTTTHPAAPMTIVHGPAVEDVGFNSGSGAFGPGNKANAAVGRAIRFILMNIGGAKPGAIDRATQGQPSKYSFCVGENRRDNPWPTYEIAHAGFDEPTSSVTVFASENPHNVNDHVSSDAEGVLATVCSASRSIASNGPYYMGGEMFVLLCPEHAEIITRSGFDRADIQTYLFERARLTRDELAAGGMWGMQTWPAWMTSLADRPGQELPIVMSPAHVRILVVGGPGRHSSVLLGFGASTAITAEIAWPARRSNDSDNGGNTT